VRILIACNVKTNGKGNPYVLQLLHSLEKESTVEAVQHGTSWLYLTSVHFDVIHFQWPEAIFDFREPTPEELHSLKKTLHRWKSRGAKIVTTVHNKYPHGDDTKRFKELYKLVYEVTDGFIHLGKTSKSVVRQRYSEEVRGTSEVIIPHGNYKYFPNYITKEVARKRLALPSEEPVVLCFGELRSRREIKLLRRGFSSSDYGGERLVVASRLPYQSLRDWRHLTIRLPFWLHPRIQLNESFISPENVQVYLNAADVLVIPRIDSLNSGNVALGWTFGTVVVGPSEGVIGEMLKSQNCPTFDSQTGKEFGQAIERGLKQKSRLKGEGLKRYANSQLSWSNISDKHIDFYSTV
jgi:glycosyltransferase involved in cell wall biosynthesis